MILSHLADDLLAACPLTQAGFLFWVFTPPGADTWVHGIHVDPDPDIQYAPDLIRSADAGATWAEDTGGWPDSYIVGQPWISSNTNGWFAFANDTAHTWEFWRRDAGGWTLIDSLDNSSTTIRGGMVYTPDAAHAWAGYATGIIGHAVFLGTWNGTGIDWVDYTAGPDRGVDTLAIRGTADNLWLVLQQHKPSVGGDRMNAWIRQLAGSTPNPDYTDGDSANVDSICNELYPCPDGSLWGAGWQWQNDAAARHAAVWRHDGSTGWTVSTPPLPATEATSRLYGVHGVSAEDVWAVGYWVDTSNTTRVLIEHWDGSDWTIVTPSPDYSNAAGIIDPYLVAVQMRAADDGWAVGAACDRWLSMHWDGSAWTEAPITGV
jgi:hypothetical protein